MKEKSVKDKETEVKKPAKVRKKTQRNVPVGIAHVLASFNNKFLLKPIDCIKFRECDSNGVETKRIYYSGRLSGKTG